MSEDLLTRVQTEADQCRNDGADDIARLLDEVAAALAPSAAEGDAPTEWTWPAGECHFAEIADNSETPHLRIKMGHGRIEVGDAVHDGLPALWFGNDGQGLGFERDRNDKAKSNETVLIVTFENLAGLEAIEFAAKRVRAKMEADASKVQPKEAAVPFTPQELVRMNEEWRGRIELHDSEATPVAQAPAPGPVAWVPYLSDRADGVAGHYAIARWNPAGYREVWNLRSHRWASASDDVLSLEEADSLLRQIAIPTVKPAPVAQTFTEGHCAEKRKPGGCQLHNLHCGYPACDRKAVVQAPAVAPLMADTLLGIWRKHYPLSVPGQLTANVLLDVQRTLAAAWGVTLADGSQPPVQPTGTEERS